MRPSSRGPADAILTHKVGAFSRAEAFICPAKRASLLRQSGSRVTEASLPPPPPCMRHLKRQNDPLRQMRTIHCLLDGERKKLVQIQNSCSMLFRYRVYVSIRVTLIRPPSSRNDSNRCRIVTAITIVILIQIC